MTISIFEFASVKDARARVSKFTGHADQPDEFHVCLEAPPFGGFAEQLAEVEALHHRVMSELNLGDSSAVLRRILLSDLANQMELLKHSYLADNSHGAPIALSIVEQPPLEGRRVCLWDYHIRSNGPLKKRALPHGILVERSGHSHIWTTQLKAAGTSAFAQTAAILHEYGCELASVGATLRDHAVRTWFFLRDIDAEYAALVDARKRHFGTVGLTAESHYISSTGIAGGGRLPSDRIHLDAYAIGGLAPDQVKFLTAPHLLGPTHLYGVTFERGTRISYRDRSHVYISGTASIDPTGNTLHLGDVERQCQRALANIEALLADAGGTLSDAMHLIAYIRDPADGPRVTEFLNRRCGQIPRVLVHAAVCRPTWLVEFECIALVAENCPGLLEF